MKKSIFFISLGLALSMIFCMGFSALAADKIKVGVVLPLTGKQAKFGEIEKNSFMLALEEINGKGGVKGKKIDLIIEDDTSKPDVGRSAIEKLIARDKVIVVGGGYSSSVTYGIVRRGPAAQSALCGEYRLGGQDHRTRMGLHLSPEPAGE